ncbi:phage holin family protein [Clavibacter zhangzhiyongii]|uniref:Phage holin family protein n=1 Tax=Clavibacter zhangzhiyongii TaxID=2768071 RepID=A0A7L7Z2W6_9MICO|nr:phage holin family protein [Clavibacter zhangzhiyongii]QOD44056.1 phage holin family protein [Clavibacter zhangzhiyongii]
MITRFAKEITSPGGAIGGGVFFLVFGLIATLQTLADPGRVGYRGTPFAVLAGGMLLVGLVTLLAGLKARRMRRAAQEEADRVSSTAPGQHDGGAPGGTPPS